MIKIKKLLSTIGLGVIGGLLGAFGGAGGTSKQWRRLGIPLLITFTAILIIHNYWILTIMSMCGALSIGYGIPCFIPLYEDEGSLFGKFYFNLFKGNEFLANITTRGTIGIILSLSLISIPILKGNWLVYGLCSFGIISIYSTVSWRNLKTFKAFGKDLLYSEFITYTILSILTEILIFL